jgi:hypothetical protein
VIAKVLGLRKDGNEQAIVAADRPMTASDSSNFCGIDNIRHLFSPLSPRQMVGVVSSSSLLSTG